MARRPFESLALLLICACTSAPQTPVSGRSIDTTAHTERALLDPADFRQRFVDVAKRVKPAVVTITSVQTLEATNLPFQGESSPFSGSPFDFFFRGPPGPPLQPHLPPRREGTGSGVIIDPDGTILTNNHVVEGADEIKVILHDEHELKATVVGTDPKTDLAVIRIDAAGLGGRTLTAAPLGNSQQLQVGEWVMAIGAPFGLQQTVSAGIISALGRGRMGIADYEDFIQTDAAINPGNSGGPLVDLEGRIIGINTAIASHNGGYQGIGFAVPVDMVRKVTDQLIANGSVVRGYLGILITDLTPQLADSFGFKGKSGILVQDVTKESPGAAAGLKSGDIIMQRDGEAVRHADTFRNAIAATPPESKVQLKVFRDGKELDLLVTLGTLPSETIASAGGTKPGEQQARWGLSLGDVTDEVRARLKLDANTKGAVVMQIQPGSSAERALLRVSDVIVQVGSEAISSAAQASARMQAAPRDKPLRVRILREGNGLFVILPPIDED
jgi:serine protease Do